jgi:hypothetical protein
MVDQLSSAVRTLMVSMRQQNVRASIIACPPQERPVRGESLQVRYYSTGKNHFL